MRGTRTTLGDGETGIVVETVNVNVVTDAVGVDVVTVVVVVVVVVEDDEEIG